MGPPTGTSKVGEEAAALLTVDGILNRTFTSPPPTLLLFGGQHLEFIEQLFPYLKRKFSEKHKVEEPTCRLKLTSSAPWTTLQRNSYHSLSPQTACAMPGKQLMVHLSEGGVKPAHSTHPFTEHRVGLQLGVCETQFIPVSLLIIVSFPIWTTANLLSPTLYVSSRLHAKIHSNLRT